jgi:hypothetical protein
MTMHFHIKSNPVNRFESELFELMKVASRADWSIPGVTKHARHEMLGALKKAELVIGRCKGSAVAELEWVADFCADALPRCTSLGQAEAIAALVSGAEMLARQVEGSPEMLAGFFA